MATDTGETPSSPSQPPSYTIGQPRHFYLAVDRLPFKMETLVDLLGVVGRRSGLPMVLCCSSRDELDAVCSTVSSLPYISLSSLYSDLAESDRAQILENFRHAVVKWNQSAVGDEDEEGLKSHMVVVTDACLPIVSSESPLPARILINYELPAKKEIYMRRMAACLASDGIVINMVVGGEVVTLKSIEEASNLIIAEMPIQVSEIL
ncbi:ATP-dependent RNA helicase eIF4A-like [Chenopodium quinoa]|uniref:Eukaryotic initiation factor 4a n=1 Tax=Chenopodium quinoa TaxID=63459 RepID=A0A803KXW4_CHEQI|nr:ATP-dependent RNA helicase eIF4A-like [Chenopodium quinoa]XP_021714297.1 ATP-dependent RNA helicase eIF4A-like [Chenopodium quinoa]